MAATPAPTESECRLLSLPSELRNRIYEEALWSNGKVHITADDKPPGLLSTCLQIRKEASELYYKTNTFYLNTERCVKWLKALQTKNRMSVQHVRLLVPITMERDWTNKALLALRRAREIKVVRVHLGALPMNRDLTIEVSIEARSGTIWVREREEEEDEVPRTSLALSTTSSMEAYPKCESDVSSVA